ncbi:DUF1573 domain-containing protein [Christiangramia sabulilitoris]|uniref:DUF1573 domain-containing protein n=1 Tax=Christiangramia sabulilitoris TaxID=2583991 RepID=A0A550I3K8_9FLAO|nr:DUF1573 domain-containing protein [Christiangramia sabulilitoris]TRO65563.1 DUF1573 domain-containing protein [Christiangramia sabulilitoris]
MKKLIAIAIFVFAGMSVAQAQKVAKMEFKSETIDYGEIKKGSDGVRVFEVKNIGDAPLIIEDVKSSCGCTVPKKPENPIMPGETGEIQVKYDTKRVGPIRKTVTVYSNSNEPVKALKIKGAVIDVPGTTDGDS